MKFITKIGAVLDGPHSRAHRYTVPYLQDPSFLYRDPIPPTEADHVSFKTVDFYRQEFMGESKVFAFYTEDDLSADAALAALFGYPGEYR